MSECVCVCAPLCVGESGRKKEGERGRNKEGEREE